MREAVTDAQQRPGFPLRSLRSLQDGDENRGQLFALLSQRRELFHANNPEAIIIMRDGDKARILILSDDGKYPGRNVKNAFRGVWLQTR